MEHTEWPKGSQASCGVLRGDPGLLSRPHRKIRASSHNDGGISWFFPSCCPTCVFFLSCGRKPWVPSTCVSELRELLKCLRKPGIPWSWEGPLGTPLGLVQWKRASSWVEVGNSAFLSISDFDCRVSAELEQESQTPFCVKERNSAFFSCCLQGDSH